MEQIVKTSWDVLDFFSSPKDHLIKENKRNLSFLRQEALDLLFRSIPENIELYASQESPWMNDFFVEREIRVPVFRSDIEIPDVDLILGSDSKMMLKTQSVFMRLSKNRFIQCRQQIEDYGYNSHIMIIMNICIADGLLKMQ